MNRENSEARRSKQQEALESTAAQMRYWKQLPISVAYHRAARVNAGMGTLLDACDHLRFVFLKSGTGLCTFSPSGVEESLTTGALLLVRAGEGIRFAAEEDSLFYLLGFDGFEAEMLLQRTHFGRVSCLSLEEDEEAVRLFESLLQEQDNSFAARTEGVARFYLFFSHLIRRNEEAISQLRSAPSEPIQQALAYIARNYTDPNLSVQEVTDFVHMSRRSFNAHFVKQLMVTPALYINRFRVEKACLLLRNPSATAASVAKACGFHSPALLHSVFFRLMGVTPMQYYREAAKCEEAYFMEQLHAQQIIENPSPLDLTILRQEFNDVNDEVDLMKLFFCRGDEE